MDLRKLKRSLLLKVVARLKELHPEASVTAEGEELIRLDLGDRSGEVRIAAMAEACHAEDRSNWGAIAGGFTNLVASRINAWYATPLAGAASLEQLLPAICGIDPRADRLIAEGTPTEELAVVGVPWLDGLRVELDCGDAGRVLARDLASLGVTLDEAVARGLENMDRMVPQIGMARLSDSGVASRVCAVRKEGLAPAMLYSEAGRAKLLQAVSQASRDRSAKVLACAPRSGSVYCCNLKDKAATAHMVGRAWAEFDGAKGDGIPLSPRLFTYAEPSTVRFLDVGIGYDRVAEWRAHDLGQATFRTPDDWWVKKQDEKWILWAGADGPRIRLRFVTAGGGSPSAARQLAERVRQKHASAAEIGHGFFNGLPWAWVDTGFHEGFATASMFVVLPKSLLVIQTEIPAEAGAQAVEMQKIIATVAPSGS